MRCFVRRAALLLLLLAALVWARPAAATPTRNQVLPVLPAPGPVKVDGNWDDWDLTGGIFVCGNVEQRVNTYSVWLHAMYDDKGLYLLARWTDVTPLNNTVAAGDDNGWMGDCLQVRLGFTPPTGDKGGGGRSVVNMRVMRGGRFFNGGGGGAMVGITAWHGIAGDRLDIGYGQQYTTLPRERVREAFARQAFALYENKKGYSQEVFVPWALLTDGGKPTAGSDVAMLVQPNFSDERNQRIADNDVVSAESPADDDRGQYFMQPQFWGRMVFQEKGQLTPAAVPLANGKSYPVTLADGLPVINWQGLVTQDPPVRKLLLAPGLAPDRKAAIAAAIAKLGADQAADRKAARAQVLAFGPDAQPQLEEHFNDPDPELSAVARELWGAIDNAQHAAAIKAAADKQPAPGDAPQGVVPAPAPQVILHPIMRD